MHNIFQSFYDMERNFTIYCFYDAGFTLKIGDDMNGFKDENTFKTFAELERYVLALTKKSN